MQFWGGAWFEFQPLNDKHGPHLPFCIIPLLGTILCSFFFNFFFQLEDDTDVGVMQEAGAWLVLPLLFTNSLVVFFSSSVSIYKLVGLDSLPVCRCILTSVVLPLGRFHIIYYYKQCFKKWIILHKYVYLEAATLKTESVHSFYWACYTAVLVCVPSSNEYLLGKFPNSIN